MSALERKQREREKYAAAIASLTQEQNFRRALVRFVENYRALHPDFPTEVLWDSLDKCGAALAVDEYRRKQGIPAEADCLLRYLLAVEDGAFGTYEAA
jgi:hypothetical protein